MGDMARRWLIVPAVLSAMPLAAQQAATPQPVDLWGQFTTATPKAEAKAFMNSLPKRQMEVIPGCPAPFGYRSGKGGLVTISFMGSQAPAECFYRLRAQFEAQLGEPERGTAPFGSVLGYGGGGVIDTTSEGLMLVWREGEKKTKLIRTPYGGFNLIFTVREDKYLY
jgi:hypothetical protein